MDPESLGLQNPYEDGGTAAQPAGAVSPEHAPPVDVMEEPNYAAMEVPDLDSPPVVPVQTGQPGAWLRMPTATPGQGAAPAAPGDASVWESDANPYKAQAKAAQAAQPNRVQILQSQRAQLPQYAAAARQELINQGYAEDHANQLVQLATTAADNDLQRQITETVTAPAARQLVAADIATKFSTPGVRLTAADLVNEGSPQAMQARARALVETGRTRSVQTRAAQRVDTVESSGSVASGAANSQPNMSAFEMIRAGVRSSRRR